MTSKIFLNGSPYPIMTLEEETLTDGSKVTNLVIPKQAENIVIPMTSQTLGENLIYIFGELLSKSTNDKVEHL